MKIIDRYVLRETLSPFLLALALFTFLIAVRPMLDQAEHLLAKGLDLKTVGFLVALLLPQALGVTIPMAFLAGTLMGLGRLSGDREGVALLSCGVSPIRLLRPVLLLALIAGAADMFTLVKLVPDGNQRFRVETLRILLKQGEGDIKPGVFYDGFPGKVIYVRERVPGTTTWSGVFVADVSQPNTPPIVTLAPTGRLEADPDKHQVSIVLPGESIRYVPGKDGQVYDVALAQDVRLAVPADQVFGNGNLSIERGLHEMTIADLRRSEAAKRAAGVSPHPEILTRHQMFSFPVACLVFALLSLALGLHTRKEGKLGGLALGIGVIFIYYGVMALCESLTKGNRFPAEWARWMPDIVLGLAGIWALWWRGKSAGRELTISVPGWLSGLSTPKPTGMTRTRVRIIIRLPDLWVPRPRLLDLYVGGRYLNIAVLAFFGLLGLYYISTLIDKSERLAKGQADFSMLMSYFYHSTPQFVVYVVPMAILVAVLATIGGLTRSGELVVMRACGVSIYRAAVPLLILALVWSGGLFLLDDRVLARANRKAEAIDDAIRGNPTPAVTLVATQNWRMDQRGRIYYFTVFDVRQQSLFGLSVFETDTAPFRLVSHAYVAKATFDKRGWVAEKGWVQGFKESGRSTRQPFASRRLNLAPPDFFRDATKEPDLMTFTELRSHINELRDSGLNLAESKVTLQERVAFPFVTVVMTLLGIPFGATTGRRGALYGIGLAIILGSAYWLANTFFLAVGQAALLPPALAAWAANLLFLSAAVYVTLTVRT